MVRVSLRVQKALLSVNYADSDQCTLNMWTGENCEGLGAGQITLQAGEQSDCLPATGPIFMGAPTFGHAQSVNVSCIFN